MAWGKPGEQVGGTKFSLVLHCGWTKLVPRIVPLLQTALACFKPSPGHGFECM